MVFALPFLLGLAPAQPAGPFWFALALLALLEFSTFLINMLPIPPFDGFGAVAPWLPSHVRAFAERPRFAGKGILFIVMAYVKPVSDFFRQGVHAFEGFFGRSGDLDREGVQPFRSGR